MSRRMYRAGDRVKLNWISFGASGPSREDREKYIGKAFTIEKVWNNLTDEPDFQDLDLAGVPYMVSNDDVEPV